MPLSLSLWLGLVLGRQRLGLDRLVGDCHVLPAEVLVEKRLHPLLQFRAAAACYMCGPPRTLIRVTSAPAFFKAA